MSVSGLYVVIFMCFVGQALQVVDKGFVAHHVV